MPDTFSSLRTGSAIEQAWSLLTMLVKENLVPGEFQRRPEESLVMDSDESVRDWHICGASSGSLLPVYHLNALACSRLTAPGGTVIDLGCGTGRFAAHLARLRPDLRIIGFDLSRGMVATGNENLREEGLADRVELRLGSMTDFSDQVPPETRLINCLFAIHHLPGLSEVEQCLLEIRRTMANTGAGFHLFDLARPRHLSTTADYLRVFIPDAPNALKRDTINSLIAAYTHDELGEVVEKSIGREVRSVLARFLPFYQAFWSASTESSEFNSGELEKNPGLSPQTTLQCFALRAILPGLLRR